jgi:hypothetical protein
MIKSIDHTLLSTSQLQVRVERGITRAQSHGPLISVPSQRSIISKVHQKVDSTVRFTFRTKASWKISIKATDQPWASANVLDEVIREDERAGGDKWEIGGVKGLHMVGLDELLLFLKDDRTIAFPGLRTFIQAHSGLSSSDSLPDRTIPILRGTS